MDKLLGSTICFLWRKMKKHQFVYSIAWNLFLITLGALIWVIGAKGAVLPHNFITGGIFGVSLLIYYHTHWLSPGIWFFLLNIPLFLLGGFMVSRRFVLYSLYGVVVTTVLFELIEVDFEITEQLYAAVAGGVVCGLGAGIILRSLGSGGGLDIIAILLNQKYNLSIGRFYLMFNCLLFMASIFQLPIDLVIASIIMLFITASVVDYVLGMFSQHKMVLIISEFKEAIANEILNTLNRGATLIKAEGAYSNQSRDILMTITNNVQLKRLEEVVFTIDPAALFIVENTFSVIGSGLGRRKVY
jgi:uncharacterized membrane-anchored protein YitT (DUF2179 family)